MMNREITYQIIRKEDNDVERIAEKYYRIIGSLNNMSLSDLEIELLVFIALNGGSSVREEYIGRYGTSPSNLSNRLKKLKQYGLVRVKGKKVIEVVPSIALDFEKDVVMKVMLVHKD